MLTILGIDWTEAEVCFMNYRIKRGDFKTLQNICKFKKENKINTDSSRFILSLLNK